MSLLYNQTAIEVQADIIIPLPNGLAMGGYQDMGFSIALKGGKDSVAADVTALLQFFGRHYPRATPVLDVNVSPAGYRPDQDSTIGALGHSGVQSVGNTLVETMVDFDQLNADEIYVKVTFNKKPDAANPATVIVKKREDPV